MKCQTWARSMTSGILAANKMMTTETHDFLLPCRNTSKRALHLLVKREHTKKRPFTGAVADSRRGLLMNHSFSIVMRQMQLANSVSEDL